MSFGEKVVKHRHIILVIALLLLIPGIIGMKATRINYDMLTYLPNDMDTVKGQNLLLNDFGKGGFSIVVTENMKTNEASALKSEISDVNHVESVLNLNDVINPNVPTDMYPDIVADNIDNDDASMLVVFFDTSTSAEETLKAVKSIRSISDKNVYVSGMSALITDLKDMCETEEAKYVAIAATLACLAMMLLLDSYVAPLIFMLSIGIAIIYNMGSNIMFGEISYITQAIAAVLQLGVTMDYSIFLWHSYEDKTKIDNNHNRAMGKAINDTLAAVTGSSITTIAGFLALCFMTYTMGKDLGLVMAKGVVLGVVSSVTLLPVLLLRFDKILMKTRHKTLIPDMKKVSKRLVSRYVVFIVIFAVIALPAIYGYQHENIVYDFTKMMQSSVGELDSDKTQFLTANQKLEDDYGIGTTHMLIADSSLSSLDGRAMSDEIKNVDGVKNVLGMDSAVGTAIPKKMLPSELEDSLIAGDHQLIMINSEYKVSTDACNNQIDEINGIVNKYDTTATLIGEGPATKDLIKTTDKDFKVVSLISIAAVFVIIFFVLKSWSMPIILVTVIEFAIYVNLGIPGYTGLELPFIVPVCISTIQLGSTVDYAILMSTKYKAERISGKLKRDAIESALASSIPSIMVSAFGFFAATFGVGLYSNISIISVFCNLMARGAAISMVTVILLLPSMLMLFDKQICKSTKGMKDIYLRDKGVNKNEA